MAERKRGKGSGGGQPKQKRAKLSDSSSSSDTYGPNLVEDVILNIAQHLDVTQRIKCREISTVWKNAMEKSLNHLVFIDNTNNVIDNLGHRLDYELQVYKNKIFWTGSYDNVLQVIQCCKLLETVKFLFLSPESKRQLSTIGTYFGYITSLELFDCNGLNANDIRRIVDITMNLKEFMYSTVFIVPGLPPIIQWVLDRNPMLESLNLSEPRRNENPFRVKKLNNWNLVFKQPLRSLYIKLEEFGPQFWESLLATSGQSLQTFISESHNINQHAFVTQNFANISCLRIKLLQFVMQEEQNFGQLQNLTTLELACPIEITLEHFPGPIVFIENIEFLQLRSVMMTSQQTLLHICQHCRKLRFFGFTIRFVLPPNIVYLISQMRTLEELHLYNYVNVGAQNPEHFDQQMSTIVQGLNLRVLITNLIITVQTVQRMIQKVNQNVQQLHFIDLGLNQHAPVNNPRNLLWIRSHHWVTFFYFQQSHPFRYEFFDWKKIIL